MVSGSNSSGVLRLQFSCYRVTVMGVQSAGSGVTE
jgi:hypothetical protein